MGYDLPMRLRFLSLAFVVFTAITVRAQSTQADIEARLLHQPLYLLGLWQDDNLKFDSSGCLLAPSAPLPFTLSGIEITKVQLKPDRLLLTGRRFGLVFKDLTLQRVALKHEGIHLELAVPPTGDYAPALGKIFTADLADLIPLMAPQWQNFATKNFGHSAVPTTAATEQPKSLPSVRRVGGGVFPPKVLYAPEPEFTQSARDLKIGGKCLVYFQIGTDGKISRVSIIRPIGVGLDERAITAVQSYKFAPATENGGPVRVEMNVEVNFQVF